ncbi:MAG: DegT/DnrJ/EryC1/StrS family aminotransferase [Marinoscillum sp.]|uniref:DegT/DnrJ/EryC1/StrS family aminotransferase n=1 Tax=Marinoscillum sp. TaxID=2024838 RepID=UPI0032F2FC65
MKIPFLDLRRQYQQIKHEIDAEIQRVLSDGFFIGGVPVLDFENAFSKFSGATDCISCANGTDALEIALKALGIGRGDEVLVPANSWVSTAEAVNNVGAEPVFVDVIEREYTIDPGLLESVITDQTKAIIPVHLYGLPARMADITVIAKKYDLKIIEDCAQAHGAQLNGRAVGTFGEAATFSFYPSKNLGAYGDAGAIVTSDLHLAGKMRRIANHGLLGKHDHQLIGRTSRLDTLQASVLLIKLHYLEQWVLKRNLVASWYNEYLREDIARPVNMDGVYHAFHLYVIRTKYRKDLIELFDDLGIGYGIHYPVPIPLINSYSYKGHNRNQFPIASKLSEEIISLPMYPELSEREVKYICDQINTIG